MNTDTRTTSIVLDTLAKLDPKQQPGPQHRALADGRAQGRPLGDHPGERLGHHGADRLDGGHGRAGGGLRLAGGAERCAAGHGHGDAGDGGEVTTLHAGIEELLLDQTNAVVIGRTAADQTGKGQLYYTTHLKTYQPVEEVEPLSRGVTSAAKYRLADCGLQPKPASRPPADARRSPRRRWATCSTSS